MSFRLAEGTEPCVRSPEQRAIRTRGVLASPMLELDPVPSLGRPRSRSERGNNPTDGWEFRWSSRAELSSPGSELIVTRSPGRRASAHQSRPAPGPVSSGRPLVCGFVRSRRKSEELQALSATRDGPVSPETAREIYPSHPWPSSHSVRSPLRSLQRTGRHRLRPGGGWIGSFFLRKKLRQFQPCLSLRETSGHTLANIGSSQTSHTGIQTSSHGSAWHRKIGNLGTTRSNSGKRTTPQSSDCSDLRIAPRPSGRK